MDDKERKKRIRQILASLRRELRDYNGEDPGRFGDVIAQLGANLRDAAEGRDAYGDGRGGGLSYAARGSTTRKVRKALGYTYP